MAEVNMGGRRKPQRLKVRRGLIDVEDDAQARCVEERIQTCGEAGETNRNVRESSDSLRHPSVSGEYPEGRITLSLSNERIAQLFERPEPLFELIHRMDIRREVGGGDEIVV
ncbi:MULTISPECIES: hypothetical protein [Brevibacterium]|uniref:hypothetical protein n=1 Tax=Brevibacterium ammoniilyticum TaxID=1046555 RepID=UPI00313A0BCC